MKPHLASILVMILGIPGGMDFFMFAEGSSGNEALTAGGAGKRAVSCMQSSVKFVARLVRERLVADIADKAFRRRVNCVDVVFEMRRRQIRLVACWALVRSSSGMLQNMQLQTVAEVKPRPALRALVRLDGAMNCPFVVVQSTGRRESFLTLVACHTWFCGTVVACHVSLQSSLGWTLLATDAAC